jgi:CHAD domain-containing protein
VRVFRPLLKRKRSRAVEEALRAMMRVFGEARDWDVFDETLTHARAPKELVTRARRRRAAARRSASEAVGSPQFRVAQLHALRWLHEAPWRSDAARAEPLLRFARGSLERAHARLLKRARRIDWLNERKRHAVRIAVKRLRYACDFFSACFPRQAVQPYLRRLAAVQDTLGELNDAAVARRLLHELEAAAGTRQWVARRERALIASLGLEWSALEKRRPYWRPKQARHRRR